MGRRMLGGALVIAFATALAEAPAAEPFAAHTAISERLSERLAVSADLARLLPPGARPPGDESRARREIAAPAPDASAWIDVEYTVDPGLDDVVREVLERTGTRRGQVILMDPASGEILAYVSADPVAFSATRTYPMASLAKLVTAAAILRHAPEAAGRDCRYVGSPWALDRAALVAPRDGGTVEPFWHALAISNNQCFARLAVQDLGAEAIEAEMAELGLLEPPAPGHPRGRFGPVEDALDLGRLGSGLAGSFISPLAAVRLAGVLARGELVRPRWIERVLDSERRLLPLSEPEPPRRVWPREVADELRELLVSVTTRGTARRAFLAADGRPLLGELRVAGKTGTLHGRDPAGLYRWFIGVAPADDARIAIAALVLDGAKEGGAARIAALVLARIFCEGDRCAPANLESRLAARKRFRAERAARSEPHPPADATAVVGSALNARELDAIPRPIGVHGLEIPPHLRSRPASGRIVLLLEIGERGEVRDVRLDSSDLPEFEAFVVSAVRSWSFTPPTRQGHPVHALARLPIPIRVR